jgi:predicted short-subunit dehydrogenase-like oxidoreductase (DUF2520 family)
MVCPSLRIKVHAANFFAASFIICADGGANQLYDMTLKFGKESIQVRRSFLVQSLYENVLRRARTRTDVN